MCLVILAVIVHVVSVAAGVVLVLVLVGCRCVCFYCCWCVLCAVVWCVGAGVGVRLVAMAGVTNNSKQQRAAFNVAKQRQKQQAEAKRQADAAEARQATALADAAAAQLAAEDAAAAQQVATGIVHMAVDKVLQSSWEQDEAERQAEAQRQADAAAKCQATALADAAAAQLVATGIVYMAVDKVLQSSREQDEAERQATAERQAAQERQADAIRQEKMYWLYKCDEQLVRERTHGLYKHYLKLARKLTQAKLDDPQNLKKVDQLSAALAAQTGQRTEWKAMSDKAKLQDVTTRHNDKIDARYQRMQEKQAKLLPQQEQAALARRPSARRTRRLSLVLVRAERRLAAAITAAATAATTAAATAAASGTAANGQVQSAMARVTNARALVAQGSMALATWSALSPQEQVAAEAHRRRQIQGAMKAAETKSRPQQKDRVDAEATLVYPADTETEANAQPQEATGKVQQEATANTETAANAQQQAATAKATHKAKVEQEAAEAKREADMVAKVSQVRVCVGAGCVRLSFSPFSSFFCLLSSFFVCLRSSFVLLRSSSFFFFLLLSSWHNVVF